MNLHKITPPKFRYVKAPAGQPVEDGPDPCEWHTWNEGYDCDNRIAWAIVDTEINETGFHGVHGQCIGHLCNLHIDRGMELTLYPV